MIRHGDVQIIKVGGIPDGAKKLNRKELAYGKVTGHAHRIDVGEIFETKNGDLYLKVDQLTSVSHEEHKTVEVKKGFYRINIKRQYSPDGWEEVRD